MKRTRSRARVIQEESPSGGSTPKPVRITQAGSIEQDRHALRLARLTMGQSTVVITHLGATPDRTSQGQFDLDLCDGKQSGDGSPVDILRIISDRLIDGKKQLQLDQRRRSHRDQETVSHGRKQHPGVN